MVDRDGMGSRENKTAGNHDFKGKVRKLGRAREEEDEVKRSRQGG